MRRTAEPAADEPTGVALGRVPNGLISGQPSTGKSAGVWPLLERARADMELRRHDGLAVGPSLPPIVLAIDEVRGWFEQAPKTPNIGEEQDQ